MERFPAGRPELLQHIFQRPERSDPAHVRAELPAIVRDLGTLDRPLSSTDAASVSWTSRPLGMTKTPRYGTALQDGNFTLVKSLPALMLELRPGNGRSKQKAKVDRYSPPTGRPFREQQRFPRHLRRQAASQRQDHRLPPRRPPSWPGHQVGQAIITGASHAQRRNQQYKCRTPD